MLISITRFSYRFRCTVSGFYFRISRIAVVMRFVLRGSGWRNADMTPRRKIRATLCRVAAARAVISDQLTKMHPQVGITEPAGSIRPHTNLRLSNFILRPTARTDRASKAP
jgi:hypothetical protein